MSESDNAACPVAIYPTLDDLDKTLLASFWIPPDETPREWVQRLTNNGCTWSSFSMMSVADMREMLGMQ